MKDSMTSPSEGYLTEFKYGSCTAEVLVGRDIMSIQQINSKVEGQGHAKQCIENMEVFAKESKIKEIWFPTVLSHKLVYHLIKNGYQVREEMHPEIDERVEILFKTIGDKR